VSGTARDSGSSARLAELDALAKRIVEGYGGRIRAYLRTLERHESGTPTSFDEVASDAFLACADAASAEDLWPMIVHVLRAHGARKRRVERHEMHMARSA
jgi:hypothetical protein